MTSINRTDIPDSTLAKKTNPPYRQIRAVYDDKTITVYQAYSNTIADAAVKEQKLNASPDYSFDRFTWVKPSWCWMMYRSGYAQKDSRQTRILALKITHENFRKILLSAAVCGGGKAFTTEQKSMHVRVQWDPERSPRIGVLAWRSLQVGIGRGMIQEFCDSMIESIEDVTDRAVKMRELLGKHPFDEKVQSDPKGKEVKKDFTVEELIEEGVMPREEVYEVDEGVRRHLRMDVESE